MQQILGSLRNIYISNLTFKVASSETVFSTLRLILKVWQNMAKQCAAQKSMRDAVTPSETSSVMIEI